MQISTHRAKCGNRLLPFMFNNLLHWRLLRVVEKIHIGGESALVGAQWINHKLGSLDLRGLNNVCLLILHHSRIVIHHLHFSWPVFDALQLVHGLLNYDAWWLEIQFTIWPVL